MFNLGLGFYHLGFYQLLCYKLSIHVPGAYLFFSIILKLGYIFIF